MVERLRPECVKCVLSQQLEKIPQEATKEQQLEYMQRIFRSLAEAPKTDSAPELVRKINDIQKELFGYEPDFSDIKIHFNQVMLGKEAGVAEKIRGSEEPLMRALQYAMIGNYIDFATMVNVDEDKLDGLLDSAPDNKLDRQVYQELLADLETAKRVVFLTDNCGEIVMDKLLIEELKSQFPNAEVTAIVRGAPTQNDATMEDAVQVGLDQLVNVMGNGSNVAGTCLSKVSQEAMEVIDSADVILAKGQGNYETLLGCGKNIYYIFMCKCDLFAREFQVPKFTGMLKREKH